jgi:hypothetical protein
LKKQGVAATKDSAAHSFRATAITNFLENDGTLEAARTPRSCAASTNVNANEKSFHAT